MSGGRTTIGVAKTTRDRVFNYQCDQHLKTLEDAIIHAFDKLAVNGSSSESQEKAHV